MAYIGTNNLIMQFRQNIENTINDALREGVPPVVIKLVLENYGYMNENLISNMIRKEDERYRQQLHEEQEKQMVHDTDMDSILPETE